MFIDYKKQRSKVDDLIIENEITKKNPDYNQQWLNEKKIKLKLIFNDKNH